MYIIFEGTNSSLVFGQMERMAGLLTQAGNKAVLINELEGLGKVKGPLAQAVLNSHIRKETFDTRIVPLLREGVIVLSTNSVFSDLSKLGVGYKLGMDAVWDLNKYSLESVQLKSLVFFGDKESMDFGVKRTINSYKRVFGEFARSRDLKFDLIWVDSDAQGSENWETTAFVFDSIRGRGNERVRI